ncbi:MAG: Metallo-beta-lactamase family protein [Candidatus Gottesmanbacteria bacterium GW2011_GWA2_47_9]|uniref:Metallo-beta-lactamase family protein n=1 Tax=Candidatus Gottesmanbacteria bacterium GW2011_GWA2_47_9 TaxID=1618445 RepID=A0A0G1TZW2_9BACT|nr:MAG: Metallo-beta-lactamase family protein [Candidatus Gottesmanbacteria bacterium GW2011_GWA2_47_9]
MLGASVVGELNDYSVVLWLRYGDFDAIFTGDADTHIEEKYRGVALADNRVEVLKVPHHGSKTGMTEAFLDWLNPELAVISVGKNSYGHPAEETIRQLRQKDSKILRTDEEGDIEVISDGKGWRLLPRL